MSELDDLRARNARLSAELERLIAAIDRLRQSSMSRDGLCSTCRFALVRHNAVPYGSSLVVELVIVGCTLDYRFSDKDDPDRGQNPDFPCRLWEGEA